MRYVGLDLGEKTIGVAISDALLFSAQPLTVIRRNGNLADDLSALAEILKPYMPLEIVLGLPKNMNGTEGPRAEITRDFASKLEAEGYKVSLWDERLSTMAVEKVMIEADLSRKKRKKVVDQQAASYILQGFLDRLRLNKEL
ncbi:MAG: Holliday junction resolvase RuvX [Firmicutes bacterium]|nr:Holliday junction resolvase RuvX [Bacillota bacterium]MDD4262978.1 Holliday junction resolvase RuvX [Bacillota bacterium]MDD4693840.1 Holliday junction resolvase RuvX [Bacillota bacterium]